MTDDAQVVRQYVDSVEAVSALFGPDRSEMVNFKKFSVAIQREVLAMAAYIDSLNGLGFAVPYGLEERNRKQATIYFPHGSTAVE